MKTYINVRWFELVNKHIEVEPAFYVSLSVYITEKNKDYFQWISSDEEFCNFVLNYSEFVNGVIKK